MVRQRRAPLLLLLIAASSAFSRAAPAPGYDAHDLFARADAALYRAKRAGRDRVCVDAADAAPVDNALALHRHL